MSIFKTSTGYANTNFRLLLILVHFELFGKISRTVRFTLVNRKLKENQAAMSWLNMVKSEKRRLLLSV